MVVKPAPRGLSSDARRTGVHVCPNECATLRKSDAPRRIPATLLMANRPWLRPARCELHDRIDTPAPRLSRREKITRSVSNRSDVLRVATIELSQTDRLREMSLQYRR